MKNKKAAIELQIHWIFVMIIGGVILLFFIGIVVKQRGISEQKLVNELIRDIDQYISGASVAPRGAATLPVPGYDIQFTCDHIQIKNQRSLLESRVVFAPDYVDKEDRQLIVWALPWEIPYDVTNFLYATGPGIRYVFVYEDDKYDDFYNNFVTDKINKVRATVSSGKMDFVDEGSYRTRIVVMGNMDPLPQPPGFTNNKDTSLVLISDFDPRDKLPNGAVYFLKYNPTTEEFEPTESNYVGVPSLVGAIFSSSVDEYNCAMTKAFKNLHTVNAIFAKKVELLGASLVCPAFYGEYDQNILSQMSAYTESTENWQDNIDDLLLTVVSLRQRNFLIESQSCPLIY